MKTLPAASIVLCLATPLLTACGDSSSERTGTIEVDEVAQTLKLSATFHRANAEEGTWHLLVHEDREMASLAYFTTDVSPLLFFEKLLALGVEDENTIDCDNWDAELAHTEGDRLEYSFAWQGSERRRPLDEILKEFVPTGAETPERGLEMRFGGNHTGDDEKSPPAHDSGCLACLYTCCAGVTSNSRANLSLLRKEDNVHRYRLRPEVTLADGARVQVFIRKAR